jgi:MarR family
MAQALVATVARRHRLSHAALNALAVIEGNGGPLLAGELSARMHITSGTMTGVLDTLERNGYIHRQADPADRRRVLVDLTPAARAPTSSPDTPPAPSGSSARHRHSLSAPGSACGGPCGCHKFGSHHAACAYSWISPPSRSRRRIPPAGGKLAGSPGPSGGACPNARCGRWPL